MKTKSVFTKLKILVISLGMMFLANGAMAADQWTNWFTITQLEAEQGTNAAIWFGIYADTIDTSQGCSTNDKYLFPSFNESSATGNHSSKEQLYKLATLAYTGGWQVRLYLSNCINNRPAAYRIQIKK